jgi:peptidoglycan-associated lipoprotein
MATRLILASFIVLVMLTGCAGPKPQTTAEATGVGSEAVETPPPPFEPPPAAPAPKVEEPQRVAPPPAAPAPPPAPAPVAPPAPLELKDVFFDFDQYVVRDQDKAALEANVGMLKANPAIKLRLEGHCDERGTSEYNLVLGEQRAQAVKRFVTAMGVDPSRVSTISYGKERPFCSQSSEDCYQQNRRAHFVPE